MRKKIAKWALALAIAAVSATSTPALAQMRDDDDRGWRGRGPWMMGDGNWPMMGPGMMGPGMMGPGMGPMMLVMMDTDGDGSVSYEEMEAVHRRMFDLVDQDGDGKVTLDEMREFHGGWSDDR